MIPLHLGGLHPFEQWLVVAIAFGPFVALAFVVYFVRRHDLREEQEAAAPTVGTDGSVPVSSEESLRRDR